MSPKRIALRTRDVAIALASCDKFGQALGKLQLQKFVYLTDALGGLFEALAPSEAHRTYKHGPFDAAIQDAVDCLAFRGFVSIEAVAKHGPGGVTARYRLNQAGRHWVALLKQTGYLERRFKAGRVIAARIERLGWQRLRQLVYAEPTFVAREASGHGQELSPATEFDSSTRELISIIRSALESGWSEFEVSEEAIVEVFFRYLDTYSRASAQATRFATEEQP